MKASILFYIAVFILVLVVIFVFGQKIISGKAPVFVADMSGSVEVQAQGQKNWQPSSFGSSVSDGDTVRTTANSEISLNWPNATHIWVGPNAQVELGRSKVNTTTQEAKIGLSLSAGKIWVKTRKSSTGKLNLAIKTPDAVVAVTGTIFSVEVKPDGTNQVEAFEGTVQILKEQTKKDSLSPRNIWTYNAKTKIDKKAPMTEQQISAWQQNQKISGAFLSIDQPKEGEQVKNSIMTMSGYTDSGNVVTVTANGSESNASVDAKGQWTVRLTPQKGENILRVHAMDGEGRQRTMTRKVLF